MHKTIEPSILYFGTPVVVVSTLNEDESTNIAPMSSAWWLGWSCMLGLDATSKTTANLRRTGECVLNLAADQNVGSVNDLVLLTGSASLPPHKKALGYRSSARKFEEAGLTRQASELVRPEGIREFPVHLEATVQNIYDFATNDPRMAIRSCAVEVTIHRVHAEDGLLDKEHPPSYRSGLLASLDHEFPAVLWSCHNQSLIPAWSGSGRNVCAMENPDPMSLPFQAP